MSSFFRRTKIQKTTKAKPETSSTKAPDKVEPRKRRSRGLQEEIGSDSDVSDYSDPEISNEEEDETPQQKRLRLAKSYLNELEERQKEESDKKELDREALAHRLKEESYEKVGRLRKKVAENILPGHVDKFTRLSGLKFPATCLALSSDGKYAVAGSKDGRLIKWNIENSKKENVVGPRTKTQPKGLCHRGQIWSIAVSSDDKLMCTGGDDGVIKVWNFENFEKLKDLIGHKNAVTGLTFRKGHPQLYSCSKDKSIKVWNMDQMAYMDTMFGHQDAVTSTDCLSRENCVTSGGRDHSLRLWKIADEKHLVFNAHPLSGTMECVRMIDEDRFISGSADGSINVWSTAKKRSVCLVRKSHDENENEPCWICSVAALPYSDLIASGSHDGFVRLWKVSDDFKNLTLLHKVPVNGFVNDMRFTLDGSKLVCAIGKEHKEGRWWHIDEFRNQIVVIPFITKHITT